MKKAGIEPVFFCSHSLETLELAGERVFQFKLGELAKLTEKLLAEGIEELTLAGSFAKLDFFQRRVRWGLAESFG